MKNSSKGVNLTAERLIELRTSRGLTQGAVAKTIGVSLTSYVAWEVGELNQNGTFEKRPVAIKSPYICALAALYGVSCDYLLGRSNYMAIDGNDVAALTGLSDGAIKALTESAGLKYSTLAADVSQLIENYTRYGDDSLLRIIHTFASVQPDTVMNVNTNTGRQTNGGLYGTDIPVGGALLYLASIAMQQYRADVQKKQVSK